jgi:hypothetical protein
MNLPAVDMQNFPAQDHTISLEDAIERTAVWRSSLSNLFASRQEEAAKALPDALVPKSMHIKMNDILQIAIDYLKVGIPLSGVRLYFTLEDNNINNDYHVKGILVPTISNAVVTGMDDDLIIPVPIAGPEDTATGVSIYDFTRPCPTYCGGSSPELTGESTSKKNAHANG